MVPLTSLILPIVLAAVLVFVASSIIHMALAAWHREDLRKLPDEDGVMAALRPFNIPPGDYMMPRGMGPESIKDPAFKERWEAGPRAIMTVFPSASMAMGKQLVQWFLYCLLVVLFAAYVASRTLPADAPYLQVFRITGTVAFAGFGLAHLQDAIWWHRNRGAVARTMIDALVYALLTAGVFGWRW